MRLNLLVVYTELGKNYQLTIAHNLAAVWGIVSLCGGIPPQKTMPGINCGAPV